MGMTLLAMSVCVCVCVRVCVRTSHRYIAITVTFSRTLWSTVCGRRSAVSVTRCVVPLRLLLSRSLAALTKHSHWAQRSWSPECYEQYHLRLHGGSYRKLMTVRCHFLTRLKRTLFIEALTSLGLDCFNCLFTHKQRNVVIYNSVLFVSPRRTELTVWLKMAGEEHLWRSTVLPGIYKKWACL